MHTYTPTNSNEYYYVYLMVYDTVGNQFNYVGSKSISIKVENPKISLANDSICPGESFSISVPYTGSNYTWNMGDGTTYSSYYVYHNYANAGTYTISVTYTDNECGTITLTKTMYVGTEAKPEFDFYFANNVCPNDSIEFSSSWIGYNNTYYWSFSDGSSYTYSYNKSFKKPFSNSGDYTVTLTVTNSCGGSRVITKNIHIEDNLQITSAWAYVSSNKECPNTTISYYTNTIAYTYDWNFGDGEHANTADANHSYTAAGNYDVSLTLTNGCGNDTALYYSVIINANMPFSDYIYYETEPEAICPSGTIFIEAESSSAISYSWNYGDGTSETGTGEVMHTFNNLSLGIHNVYLTVANGCGNDSTIAIPITVSNNLPFSGYFEADVEPSLTCAHEDVMFYSVMYFVHQYSWNYGDGSTSGLLIPNSIESEEYNLSTHSYANVGNFSPSLTMYNSCGSDSTVYFQVTVTDTIKLDNVFVGSTMEFACPNDSVLFISENYYNIVYNFGDGTTSTNPGFFIDNGYGEKYRIAYHAYSSPGTYKVIYTVTNGCNNAYTDTLEVVVMNNAPNQMEFGFLNGNSTYDACAPIKFYGYGGNNYQFNFGDGQSINSSNGFVDHTYATPGLYTITATITNSCGNSTTQTETANVVGMQLNTIISSPKCSGGNDGSINLSVSNGNEPYTYYWSNGNTNEDISTLSSGDYIITVTDNGGCYIKDTINVPSPSAVSISTQSVTDATCHQITGSACVSVSGGTSPYTYSWNVSSQTNSCINNVGSGTYQVTVTDNKGCTENYSVGINDSNGPTATISSPVNLTCYQSNNGSANGAASGGTPNYTYLWTPSNQTTANASSLSAGTHVVKVTDANGCIGTSSVTLTEPQEILITVDSLVNVKCFGESNGYIRINATGGVNTLTYTWTNSVSTNTIASGLSAAAYVVTVKDANNCSSQRTVYITQPTALNLSFLSLPDTVCETQSAITLQATPTGGTFAGQYVSGNSFDAPDGASKGYGVITYSFTNTNGCSAQIKDSVFVNVCSGINDLSYQSRIITYPNPVKETLFIEANNEQIKSVEIYNVQGQLIKTVKTNSIGTQDLPSGVYGIRVRTSKSFKTGLFIKE